MRDGVPQLGALTKDFDITQPLRKPLILPPKPTRGKAGP